MPLGEKTYIMGILNVTPDSFSDGNKYFSIDKAVDHAFEMQKHGADIIDIGAQSTKPGCVKISPQEELERLIPVLKALNDKLDVPISIDTFYPQVVKEALKYNVSIINDVTGFKDDNMIKLATNSDCGCIVMYDGSLDSMKKFFQSRIKLLIGEGISKERICFDPGMGFGKSYEENLSVLNNLKKYIIDGTPMLIGASKKRFINAACKENIPPENRLYGTIAAHTVAIMNGADIIRVHDVSEAVQAAKVADAILSSINFL